jgi:sporulation protein YlmC with PRC-barrel domain
MAKEITMKRNIVTAATAILYLCSSIAAAQQTQQAPSGQSGTSGMSGQPAAPGASGTAGTAGTSGTSGAAGTSGAPGAAGTSGAAGQPPGPVAGRSVLGVTVVEMEAIILGWSARKDLLGKAVVNDAKEKIGQIEDIIITPDSAASYAIIGVGGFLGIGERRVAIPFQQIKMRNSALVLPGATRDALKALPEFKYAPRR